MKLKSSPYEKPKKYTEAQLDKAKKMYMNYMSIADIAEKMGMPRTSVSNYVQASWKKERQLMSNDLLNEVTANKRVMLTKLAGKSIDLIGKALHDLSRKTELSAYEANVLAGLLDKIDKIMKLDAGQATDIIAEAKPATIVEIQRKLEMDPFYIEEAEVVEENNEENDNDVLNVNSIRSEYESGEHDTSNEE